MKGYESQILHEALLEISHMRCAERQYKTSDNISSTTIKEYQTTTAHKSVVKPVKKS